MRKVKLFLALLMIGFLFVILDVDVHTGFSYPNDYENNGSVIGEYQYYTIYTNYGATCTYKYLEESSTSEKTSSDINLNTTQPASSSSLAVGTKVIDQVFFSDIKLDIFNDILGFIFIAIGCLGFRKCSQRFILALLTSIGAIVINFVISLLPFVSNGLTLCNIALLLGILYGACIILTIYFFANGLYIMCTDISCRDERKWCRMIEFVSIILVILSSFVFWLGADYNALTTLGNLCVVLNIILILNFWRLMNRTGFFLEKSYISKNSK